MDEDARDLRRTPRTWREYLRASMEIMDVFQWAWNVMPEGSKRRIPGLVAALLIATVAYLLLPRTLGIIVEGTHSGATGKVFFGFALTAACIAVHKLADYRYATAREWILGLNWGAIDDRITREFFAKSAGQHIRESSLLAVSNIDKGRWRLLDLQGMLLFEGIPSLLSLAVSYALLFTLSLAAGLIMTLPILVYLLYTLYLNQRVMEVCTPIDAEFRKLNRYRVERWEKAERVKNSNRSEEERTHTDSWFNKAIGVDREFWLWFVRQNMLRQGTGAFGFLAVLGYGYSRVRSGAWDVSLLLPLFFWSMQVVENIWRVGHVEHALNWNAPSVRSMIAAVSLPPDVISGSIEIDREGPIEIRLDNVSHSYREEMQDDESGVVLKDVNFAIGRGEKVALLGGSGCGKTTVMRLLLRYMDPQSGTIRINGADLRELDLASWLRCVGYIPQHAQIFDGTLRDNLMYALPEDERRRVSDAELWELMRLLKIDFGKRLRQGLDTLVGRNGLKLSGGQAQRLVIGAAAMKHPTFMIVDEATSHLDSTTEKEVQEGLARVMHAKMGALIVAHRLSTLRLCDRFVVMRPAEEIQNGDSQVEAAAHSFEELYALSPTFRRLADDQGLAVRSIGPPGPH